MKLERVVTRQVVAEPEHGAALVQSSSFIAAKGYELVCEDKWVRITRSEGQHKGASILVPLGNVAFMKEAKAAEESKKK